MSPSRTPGTQTPIQPIIFIPGYRRQTVRVRPSNPISSLQSLIPDADFIFKGEVLNENQTFSFYDIQSKDTVVALPKRRSGEVTQWTRITRHYDDFQESMRSATNFKTENEGARLRDLFWRRREMRPGRCRRMFYNLEAMDNQVMMPKCPTVIPPTPTTLSETPLAVWWEAGSK
jgi:hypothetical protein